VTKAIRKLYDACAKSRSDGAAATFEFIDKGKNGRRIPVPYNRATFKLAEEPFAPRLAFGDQITFGGAIRIPPPSALSSAGRKVGAHPMATAATCRSRSWRPAIARIAVAIAVVSMAIGAAQADNDRGVAALVNAEISRILPPDGRGGAAVVVRVDGNSSFFNFGMADDSRPVTSDLLFNLGSVGKVFDTALLALADQQGELSLDDPVAKYVVELQAGGDIRQITLRQLASYTSGFVLPQDHPPWPEETFTLPAFIAKLKAWKADAQHLPGQQMIYSHAGFVLIHLALERRFGMLFDELMRQRLLDPLGLASTTLPVASADPEQNPRGEIPQDFTARAVQGYTYDGTPVGAPGNLQGYYHWLGTGQMYASARDMAVFLMANIGELPDHTALQSAMQRAQEGVLPVRPSFEQAMAWEVHKSAEHPTLVDKYGGMNNASAYIGMVRGRPIGIVILSNRGSLDVAAAGRKILLTLAAR
jgi:beta-lactamase class C